MQTWTLERAPTTQNNDRKYNAVAVCGGGSELLVVFNKKNCQEQHTEPPHTNAHVKGTEAFSTRQCVMCTGRKRSASDSLQNNTPHSDCHRNDGWSGSVTQHNTLVVKQTSHTWLDETNLTHLRQPTSQTVRPS